MHCLCISLSYFFFFKNPAFYNVFIFRDEPLVQHLVNDLALLNNHFVLGTSSDDSCPAIYSCLYHCVGCCHHRLGGGQLSFFFPHLFLYFKSNRQQAQVLESLAITSKAALFAGCASFPAAHEGLFFFVLFLVVFWKMRVFLLRPEAYHWTVAWDCPMCCRGHDCFIAMLFTFEQFVF